MSVFITNDSLISCELEAWLYATTKSEAVAHAIALEAYTTLEDRIDNNESPSYELHRTLTVSGRPEIFHPSIAAVQELQNA